MADEIDVSGARPTGTADGAARQVVAVTPDDDTPLAQTSRAISCAVAGNVKLALAGMALEDAVVVYLVAGVLHPIEADYILATSTTATDIRAWN